MIINIIISARSWKKINCSMRGDALSCNVRFIHVAIISNESLNTLINSWFQFNANQFYFINYAPLHVSGTHVPIFRRINYTCCHYF